MRQYFLFTVTSLLVLQACTSGPGPIEAFTQMVEGSWSNSEQAASDSMLHEITLHITAFDIAGESSQFIYYEEAVADLPDQPYRQGILELKLEPSGAILAETYYLPDPARYTGSWKDATVLYDIDPGGLIDRSGCAIRFIPAGVGGYTGTTSSRECYRQPGDSVYVIETWYVIDGQLIKNASGHDAQGELQWGLPAPDGYIFERQ